jgi:hypothetical protein
VPEHLVTADRFVGRADELRRIEAACVAAARGRGGAPALWPWLPVLAELCGPAAAELLAHDAAASAASAGRPADDPATVDVCRFSSTAGPTATGTAPRAVDPDRFARFAAVTDRLAEACARAPACLVIDDVHAADAGTLLLVRFMARSLPRLR